ncbi:RNA polymerase II transcription mediator complex subunit 9-domain-containing protein [Ampelomyces quisqualis]|uniref:Mediator of RNA polymerase II transcription subunit 9 n=1 Tax=Ampelomyces quisqualis TaxID=50730 RepID=A0A6A5QZG0_AMPQU|nr:RNA polymerase II transcription mediator complex subunit 9-domain-containing protein [Ampelomyces quisqualis]
MSAAPTPHASASARASQPPTGAATPAPPPAAPATPAIPPPSTFDVLPDLHRVLARLLETSAQPPAATPSPSQPSADGPLEIQHVATAANDVRLKMQKARRAVLALPDVDRTCEDQDDEIADLEARIARLKASLRELARPVEEPADEDQSMTG